MPTYAPDVRLVDPWGEPAFPKPTRRVPSPKRQREGEPPSAREVKAKTEAKPSTFRHSDFRVTPEVTPKYSSQEEARRAKFMERRTGKSAAAPPPEPKAKQSPDPAVYLGGKAGAEARRAAWEAEQEFSEVEIEIETAAPPPKPQGRHSDIRNRISPTAAARHAAISSNTLHTDACSL